MAPAPTSGQKVPRDEPRVDVAGAGDGATNGSAGAAVTRWKASSAARANSGPATIAAHSVAVSAGWLGSVGLSRMAMPSRPPRQLLAKCAARDGANDRLRWAR